MKPLLLLILAVAGLAGCVAVPVEGPRPYGPGYVVAPPPPVVVVRPYPYYRYGWHRRWY